MIAPDPRESGLTLVEMLVVLAIVGVMAGTVVLSAGAGSGRGAEVEARRLAARLELAADETMVTGRPVAFVGGRSGYRFLVRQAGRWRDETAPALEPYTLPSGLTLEGAGAAPVVIGADGGGSPLDLRLVPARGTGWAIAFDGVAASAKAGG
ncbi:GspH/FimT family pseudopilin [Sphingomonas sp. MMS24-J13]|uniref:GspH/FimT family pseudopilin n=1 Tax=Sphingomonas sp. MMS24-J13 TaxID=3238686 RepID=UPI00384E79CD